MVSKLESVTAAMSARGVEGIDIVEGTTNRDAFLEHNILPIVQPSNPRSLLVLDNASIHHVNELIDQNLLTEEV